MKLKFTAQSLKDLHRLKAFIAQKNPIAAAQYIERCSEIVDFNS